jgi:hypothetical protein
MLREPSLQDPLRFNRKTPPCAVVIFGANGDLTKRKLMPALYRLAFEGRLAPGFAVVGISRTAMSDDEFRERMRESVAKYLEDSPFDEDLWRSFAQGLFYMAGDVADQAAYQRLAACLEEVQKARQTGGNTLFYLSTQPSQYAPIAEGIGAAGLAKGDGWRRIIIEKPFGHDLKTAKELNARLQNVFDESAIYRIDHYLGKETVQNILAFRFGNGIFEPLWNRRYIDHVQITAAESIGVEGRGAYYGRRAAGHDPEPLAAGAGNGCDGAERYFFGGRGAGRAFEAAAIDSRHEARRSGSERRSRAVWPRPRGRGTGAGIPPGKRSRQGIADGDLCRSDIPGGKLALGGRAVLCQDRQISSQTNQRGGDPFSLGPTGGLS